MEKMLEVLTEAKKVRPIDDVDDVIKKVSLKPLVDPTHILNQSKWLTSTYAADKVKFARTLALELARKY